MLFLIGEISLFSSPRQDDDVIELQPNEKATNTSFIEGAYDLLSEGEDATNDDVTGGVLNRVI